MTINELRHAAVYGAFVAAQVQEKISSGAGAPSYEEMRSYVEEAYAVADMSEEVQDFDPTSEDTTSEDPSCDGYGVINRE